MYDGMVERYKGDGYIPTHDDDIHEEHDVLYSYIGSNGIRIYIVSTYSSNEHTHTYTHSKDT
jgi:hypothetical protein